MIKAFYIFKWYPLRMNALNIFKKYRINYFLISLRILLRIWFRSRALLFVVYRIASWISFFWISLFILRGLGIRLNLCLIFLLILILKRISLLMFIAYFIDCLVLSFLSFIFYCVSLRLVTEAIKTFLVILRFYISILLYDTLSAAFLRSLLYNYEILSILSFK